MTILVTPDYVNLIANPWPQTSWYTIAKGDEMVRSFEFYADRDLIVHDDSRAQVGMGINVWGSFRFMRSDGIHSSSISTDQRFDSR
ncbi:hypothetical protein GPALN_004609 [Globodera pallida]|nr:hypothetical protein GPALN_004609 [Globodera pallida]